MCAQQAEPNKFHDDKSLYTGTHVQGGPTSVDNVITLSNLADRSSADVRGLPKRLSGKTALRPTGCQHLDVSASLPRSFFRMLCHCGNNDWLQLSSLLVSPPRFESKVLFESRAS